GFETPLSGLPLPVIYTSGDSNPALDLAAKHADVHVLSPGAQLAARIARLRSAAAQHGRPLKLGLRLRVLSRHTEPEAQRDAEGSAIDWVGSHAQVAERFAEVAALGLEYFIVEAHPPLEEAYRFGQQVLPLLSSGEARWAASA
ncbi:MAG TPA: LLM class flavin-dependent oxidoreductase, partial [Polyangiaceae bacterium]|nr:LLM class flavin-dependent oxidoreductase [Polyangiaceae bacterium]